MDFMSAEETFLNPEQMEQLERKLEQLIEEYSCRSDSDARWCIRGQPPGSNVDSEPKNLLYVDSLSAANRIRDIVE